MYNKLFTKILDSSIWLESDYTRLVWITLLATMDEDGFCQYASVGNLAQRAILTREQTEKAVVILESSDSESSDPENDGRRIERVPGGWMVLNSKKYRELASREMAKEKTRLRVAAFRKRNAHVTVANDSVTPSEADTYTKAKEKIIAAEAAELPSWVPVESWEAFLEMRKKLRKPLTARAQKMLISKLGQFRAKGFDPAEVLDQSTMNSYQGIFEPKGTSNTRAKMDASVGKSGRFRYCPGCDAVAVKGQPKCEKCGEALAWE